MTKPLVETIAELLPCPFCGGDAEMDTMRGYRKLTNGDIDNAVAVYCTVCSADMTMCYADHTGLTLEDMIFAMREAWNRRAPSPEGGEVERLRGALHWLLAAKHGTSEYIAAANAAHVALASRPPAVDARWERMMCRADHPGMETEDIIAVMREAWNRRTAAEAKEKAEARVKELEAVVERAAQQFEFYRDQHMAKAPPDVAKADTNAGMALVLRRALTPAEKVSND